MVGMRLMAAAGVPTATSARCLLAPQCHESVRFDRVVATDGNVRRLHAEDGCQLTGHLSRQKYARQGAPTYQALAAVLNRASANPLDDREQLFRWAVANAAMGNYDAHAKNVSVVYVDANIVRLAPAYDVVVTAVYEGLDREFALYFGGTTLPQALTPASLTTAAREFGVAPAMAREMAEDVVQRVERALPEVLHDVARLGGESGMLERLDDVVRRTCVELGTRLGFGVR